MDIEFSKNSGYNNISVMTEYSRHLTGVTDDFWEEHILAAHLYVIKMSGNSIGYFTIYGGGKLTAFYMDSQYLVLAQEVFKRILSDYHIETAFVATCDELFLSLCLDFHKSIELQAYLFDGSTQINVRPPEYGRECLTEIGPDEIDAVNRQTEGFFSNMARQQLESRECVIYRMKEDNRILGYGVIVPDKTRPHLWACGMIVLPEHRRKGIGRSIQMHLGDICRENAKTPISGCWYQNHLSKKTIESAGRYTKTRLLNIVF